ncbi:MAG: alpha/beta hydrolase [Proteobacteria bacterium]|nr:alpha/beta hydrolase [Pseudomonadota bacterium]
MNTATHQRVRAGDLSLDVTVQGSGPPVIFCHGFPGLGYSWRHQLAALADAGWRAVAPDQRGYGRSDRPLDPRQYDADHVMNDMLAVLDALAEPQAVFVGHDFGAQQVCNLAVRHPQRVQAVVIMSCPYDFDLAGRGGSGRAAPDERPDAGKGAGGSGPAQPSRSFAVPGVRPSVAFAATARQHFFHMHYFQSVGPPERELGAQPREFLLRLFHALSAQGHLLDWSRFPSEGTGYLDVLAPAPPLPWSWLSEAEFEHYLREYLCAGPGAAFTGGLNSYRMADRNWELGEAYADADITQPALFIAGEEDVVLKMLPADALQIMQRRVPDLRGTVLVPGAGHFVQQEAPAAVNAALLRFLSQL